MPFRYSKAEMAPQVDLPSYTLNSLTVSTTAVQPPLIVFEFAKYCFYAVEFSAEPTGSMRTGVSEEDHVLNDVCVSRSL